MYHMLSEPRILFRQNLDGKKAVVIGGSRGTGLAIVEALQLEGAEVLVIARNPESLAELVSQWLRVRRLQADMTDTTTIETVFQDAPGIVILAGGAMPPSQPVVELDWETFSTNWNTDVKASYRLTQYALTRPAKAGTLIVFLSIEAAIGGSPISGGYAVSKRMQVFLDKTLTGNILGHEQ